MPLADLGSSFNFFFNSAAEFFRHLSEIHWTAVRDRPALPAGDAAGRAWAWRNVLRAAYPQRRIPFLPLAAAYLAGAGINASSPPTPAT